MTADQVQSAYDRRWWTLAVLCLSLIIVFVGNSSLNVTIPTLSRVLHATTSELQWVVAIYSLVFAGLLFTTGALGDRFGRKGALQLGLGIFLLAALAATRADAMWQLIGCRALMGLAGAFIMPSTLSILINVFPPGERSKAIAIWASFLGASGAIGPVISGWLLGHFWFGSVFLVNVPFIVVALVAGRWLVPTSRDPEQARLDPIGALLSILGIGALVYGLIEAPTSGWLSPSTMLAGGFAVVALVAFALWELHVEEPMLDIRYFRSPAFSVGTGGMVLVFLGMYGLMFLITQYFQLVLGLNPLAAALRTLPLSPIMLTVAPLTPRLTARFGAHRVVAFGMVSAGTGFAMFSGLGLHTPYLYVFCCFVPFTAGLALTMSPMTASIMSAVPTRRAGAGSAMNDASRELGAALGIAVLGSVAASRYASRLHHVIAQLPSASQHQARSSIASALAVANQLPHASALVVGHGAKLAFLSGIHLACIIGAALPIAAAGFVLRYLPHHVDSEATLHGALEATENMAELGIAGVPPAFAD
jgi:EmrB/QacA subfamily drug resistance transporter